MFIKNPEKDWYSETNMVYSCQYHVMLVYQIQT